MLWPWPAGRRGSLPCRPACRCSLGSRRPCGLPTCCYCMLIVLRCQRQTTLTRTSGTSHFGGTVVITGIPTATDFRDAGTTFLNLAWTIVTDLYQHTVDDYSA